MSYIPQVNLKGQIQSLFLQDFGQSEQQQQNRASPTSSYSMDSPQDYNYTPLLYTLNDSRSSPQSYLQDIPFPTKNTNPALNRPYLATLSSLGPQPLLPPPESGGGSSGDQQSWSRASSAFRRYTQGGGYDEGQKRLGMKRRENMMKRAVTYFKGLNWKLMKEQGRPTSSQLHHMIAERRRRESINECFQALRALLPRATKKDRATVLRTTKEYINQLKAQLSELTKKNHLLEAQIPNKLSNNQIYITNERLSVCITPVVESTSKEEQMVDLQVICKGDDRVSDLVIRVLEFVNQAKDQVSFVSMEAKMTHGQETSPTTTNWTTIRLKIEGSEWNESNFKEAVNKKLADFAQ